jgi:ParB/RepB/Spo0J family partition protein
MKITELNLEALEFHYEKLRVRRPDQEKRLLASLGEGAQQNPIIVIRACQAGRYTVIDGHKRVRVLKKIKADTVKSVIWETLPPEALVASYRMKAGSGYNALEESWLIEELHRRLGWNLSDAAGAMGKSKSWISRRLGLVEGLPEAVLSGVQQGKIGAYSAMKYFLPLARANAQDCEQLAGKISEQSLTSRQLEMIYQYYTRGPASVSRKIIEDPLRFLKARQEASRDLNLTPLENRCLGNLSLIGNVSLGLVKNLPEAINYDTAPAAKRRLHQQWQNTLERVRLLEKTSAALFLQENIPGERTHA